MTLYKKGRSQLKRQGNEAGIADLVRAKEQFGPNVHPLTMTFSDDVETLLSDLSEDFTPLVAGGSVRDAVEGDTAPKDVDIEVHDAPSYQALTDALRQHGYPVNEVGKAFGVLKTRLHDGTDIDLSLPRRDNRTGVGHTGFSVEVSPEMSLEEAGERRDFTINAMYYDHKTHSLIDHHGGFSDFKNGVLRHVSDAYSEDPLRVLRGMQIAARFDLKMHPDTVEASKQMVSEFNDLPTERVREEWYKLFTRGRDVEHGLAVLKETGWDTPMGLSELRAEDMARVAKAVETSKRENVSPTVAGAAVILESVPEDQRSKVASRLTVDNKVKSAALKIAQMGAGEVKTTRDVRAVNRTLGGKVGIAQWSAAKQNVSSVKPLATEAGMWSRCNSDGSPTVHHDDLVTGAMILEESGRSPGKWVGDLLKKAHQAEDDEAFVSEEGAREWLKREFEK